MAAWVGRVQLKRNVWPWLGGEATDRKVSGMGLAFVGMAGASG